MDCFSDDRMRCIKAFSERTTSRDPDHQAVEVQIHVALMNWFNALGATEIERVARAKRGKGHARRIHDFCNTSVGIAGPWGILRSSRAAHMRLGRTTALERFCAETGNTLARAASGVAIGTGQRIGVCCEMLWVYFDGEFMPVLQEKIRAKISIYFPEQLRQDLGTLPKVGRYIFGRNPMQPLGKRAVHQVIEEVREKSGVL